MSAASEESVSGVRDTGDGEPQPSDGDLQVLEPGASRVRIRLTENPVHQHFTYKSAADKSTCNICKVQLSGKNSTSLSKFIQLFSI
jgi:hypothetical protein